MTGGEGHSPDALPKTAVIGAAGFIGRSLLNAYRREHPECLGTARSASPTLARFDLAKPDIGGLRLAETGHRHAMIAAAITDVAACERDPEGTRAINVTATLEVAGQLVAEGILPIAYSSDYVFDGTRAPYPDEARPAPTTEYGRQKAELEGALLERLGPERFIALRPAKVYGTENGDGTLIDEMASRLRAGEVVRAARDQVFSPVAVDSVAAAVLEVQRQGGRGIVNVCGGETWSRLGLALAVAECVGASPRLVESISLDDLDDGLSRPKDTSMVAKRLREEFGVRLAGPSRDLPLVARTAAQ